jgi:hypothetical protein
VIGFSVVIEGCVCRYTGFNGPKGFRKCDLIRLLVSPYQIKPKRLGISLYQVTFVDKIILGCWEIFKSHFCFLVVVGLTAFDVQRSRIAKL